jgi:hypothetical protein
VEWFGNGNLATASFPSTRASWKARNLLWKLQPSNSQDPGFTAASKVHIAPDPCTITAYALGIRLL